MRCSQYLRSVTNTYFSDKSAFEVWAAVFKSYEPFSELCDFPCFEQSPTPKGVYPPWDHFGFWVEAKNHCKIMRRILFFLEFIAFSLSDYVLIFHP